MTSFGRKLPTEHDTNVAKITNAVDHIHEKTDIPTIARGRNDPLKDRGVNGDIRQVKSQPDHGHEPHGTQLALTMAPNGSQYQACTESR